MPEAKTSMTAFSVATGLDNLARMPRWRPYFTEEMLRLNAEFLRHGVDTPVKRLVRALPPRLFIRLMDAFYVPGMTQHYLFRKRLIERELLRLSARVQQTVVLGGGLDTLALRMAGRFPQMRFFEIDLPTTQRRKRAIVRKARVEAPANLSFIEADLGQTTLEAALRSDARFTPDAPTLVILEGVLMYLTETQVRALFSAVRALFGGPLTVLFGATASPDEAGRRGLRAMNAMLGRGGEAARWCCESRAIPAFVAGLGYALTAWMPYKELQRFYRKGDDLRQVPEEDENYYLMTKLPSSKSQAEPAARDISAVSLIPIDN